MHLVCFACCLTASYRFFSTNLITAFATNSSTDFEHCRLPCLVGGDQGARRAALKTNNKGFEAALEWALHHSEDKDFEDPLPGYDDDETG